MKVRARERASRQSTRAGWRARRLLAGIVALALWGTPVRAQVTPLGHPTVEERVEELRVSPDDGYRFVAFGDQKNLWRTDFPQLLDQIAAEAATGATPLLFMLDTGDIVDDGSRADQFAELAGLLAKVDGLPYLVGVGNHELQPDGRGDTSDRARRNTVRFLGPDYAPDRMFYSKQIGSARFLFLDTNDLPGVYPALHERDAETDDRAAAQIQWLREELRQEVHPTIAVAHHAFVQSPGKHRDHARTLWNHEYDDGRTLPEMLIDGGVDLVLTGHVHSYEIFELERGGRTMWSLNASGRPTGSWFRLPWTRMPDDWRNRERDEMRDKGFRTRLDQWTVTQRAFMTGETKTNQLALVAVDETGRLRIEVRAVDGMVLYTFQISGRTP